MSKTAVISLCIMAIGSIAQVVSSQISNNADSASVVVPMFWTLVTATLISLFGGAVFITSRRGNILWSLLAALPIVGPFYLAYRYWPREIAGHPPCSRCGYDLHKNTTGKCPECGADV